jgi:hypothetical protein
MANQQSDENTSKPSGPGWIYHFVVSANTSIALLIAVVAGGIIGAWLGWLAGVIAFIVIFPIAVVVLFIFKWVL